MASKVTPLYAQTRTLLKLWALAESLCLNQNSSLEESCRQSSYKTAFSQLVEDDSAIDKVKVGRYDRYIVTEEGESANWQELDG